MTDLSRRCLLATACALPVAVTVAPVSALDLFEASRLARPMLPTLEAAGFTLTPAQLGDLYVESARCWSLYADGLNRMMLGLSHG